MKHEQYRELLILSIYDELDERESQLFDAHLGECDRCRQEIRIMNELRGILAARKRTTVSDSLLQQARWELQAGIRSIAAKPALGDRLREFASRLWRPHLQIAYAAAASLVVGVIVGSVVFGTGTSGDALFTAQGGSVPFAEGETRIANVRFLDNDPATGEVEFVFEAIAPMRIRGSIEDPRIQKVLAHALISEQNPGVRLQTVSALGSQIDRTASADREIRSALLTALRTDPNPGVRMEAMNVLEKFPFDEDMKDALLHVLMNDDNSGMRIAAINCIDRMREAGFRMNDHARRVLEERMHADNNNYVRFRAMAVLQEIGHR